MVELLLHNGARIDQRDNKGDQPIHYAVRSGSPSVVALLLRKGVSVDAEGADGTTPLMQTPHKSDQHAAIKKLLLDNGAAVHHRDRHGRTALHVAAQKDPAVIRLLLDNGANVNAIDAEGYTPLHYALHKEAAAVLLASGADINAATKSGRTLLHLVKGYRAAELVSFLVESGANIEAADAEGATPLHVAAATEDLTVKALLKAGASVNARDRYGRTPLHGRFSAPVLFDLLAAGSDIHARDNAGNTPLHEAARRNDKWAMSYLLERGADPDAKNNEGLTATMLAGSAARRLQ